MAGDRSGIEGAHQIVELLERLGHDVLIRHVVEATFGKQPGHIRSGLLLPAHTVAFSNMTFVRRSLRPFGLGFAEGYLFADFRQEGFL
jgi:hypothetical protein